MPTISGKKARQSRSRNTTPISTVSSASAEQGHSTLLQTPVSGTMASPMMSYGEIIDQFCRGSSPPAAGNLKKIAESLKQLSEIARVRSENCDRGMRELSKRRKDLIEIARGQERVNREADERREKTKKVKLKKERIEEDRPLAVGAHQVAAQDGSSPRDGDADNQDALLETRKSLADAALSSVSPAPSSSSLSSQPPRPAPAIPQYQTFGPDPSTFDDPTIYHLREITDDLSEEEKREILGVTYYPHDDLHDLTPGTPPDRDFSNAKPPNQVTAQAFANYLEPYVRPLSEEDIAFLKERGNRVSPFVIPRRGPRGYKEIWSEEDGSLFSDIASHDGNATKASFQGIEQMSDDLAETSNISTGPMLARLLAAMRPERRAPPGELNNVPSAAGDTSANVANGEMEVDGEVNGIEVQTKPLPPATYLPESSQPGWKNPGPKINYSEMDDRVMQELRYMGFLSEDAEPDYDGHNDDEVAARLRYLQDELQRVSILNGARKARLLEVVEARMAQQEYSTIADDLDTQLNQAYLKRHRNIGKGKRHLKRPGGPGSSVSNGSGLSKPSVGEPIRLLMERRAQWESCIGPVVDYGKTSIPKDTLFNDENMERLKAKERENWNEAQETS